MINMEFKDGSSTEITEKDYYGLIGLAFIGGVVVTKSIISGVTRSFAERKVQDDILTNTDKEA